MSTPMTPDRAYDALGLEEDTPRKEIRKAYFRLALKHHPDKAKNEQAKKRANEQFREIQSAYETLTQDRSEDAQPSLDALRRQKA
ncbi:heat shock protein DnaJ [Venturia nashicola]|uniref:Heat shock protein DnaJ n=1 Tax=Venturia nashicola TaxID=86259 RepID=A0A4Z1NWZ6_9PEZI|nr:heat shock protein DnaJ [Venturia nashicola]